MHFLKLIFTVGMMVIFGCFDTPKSSEDLSYNSHIRPILSDKCFKCHGPDKNKRISGYRLDTEQGAYSLLKDQKDKYGVVPGHPELSDVMSRISSMDPEYMMPPPEENLTLTPAEIDLIEKWIKQGAKYEPHWSFISISNPTVPKIKNAKWATNEIDHFILAKLEQQDLQPSDIEEKQKLLKRVMHDLTGLPPTLAEQDAYLSDNSTDAYEKMVDKALSSPQYGEKMAILWMDLARYADSHGYQDDGLRTMWPWRDWVIHAFNSNYSYKKFVTWQLAGDLLPDKNKETILATGFNRNHKITQEGGVIDEEYRIEYVTDRTNTFSKGMLAMTFECAKCHDHKYDPISQKDYYRTFAFFNKVAEKGLYGDISIASLADPPYMTITKEDRNQLLTFISKIDTGDIRVMVMQDSIFRPTHLLERGVYDQKGEVVDHGTPKAIMPFDTTKFAQNRLGLSEWLFDKNNPLTARVFVNHMWQDFFGRGIVKTAGDFGLQGELPSHPQLLDWLAYDFMDHGWDIKRLVKQIVMSSTYRQSSTITDVAISKDPENIYLARGPRQKLSAELLSDHILMSSGLLKNEIGGPSVKPYQPKGLWEGATSGRGQLATYVQDHGDKLYRRGLYHFIKRTVPPPSMLIFDASNRDQCEVRRVNTTTPLQSLVMLNDVKVLEASKNLAKQLESQPSDDKKKLTYAFRSILCRNPSNKEVSVIYDYFSDTKKDMTPDKAKKLLAIGEIPIKIKDEVTTASMMQTIQLLYNLEETAMR